MKGGSLNLRGARLNVVNWGPTHHSFEWVPSQKGMSFECLHAHQATVLAWAISTCFGCRPVPLCEPSQKGWLLERPQAHHQYVPGSTF